MPDANSLAPTGRRRPAGCRLERGAALLLLLVCLACGDNPVTPSAIAPAPPTATNAPPAAPTSTAPPTTATTTSAPPAATATNAAVASATPAPAGTAPLPPTPAVTAAPPTLTDTKAVYASSGTAPFAVIYPANWTVGAVLPGGPAFADLPDFVQIADPGANVFGIQVYSGPTRTDKPPILLLTDFLAHQQTFAPLTVTAQTGSGGGLVQPAGGATFTSQSAKGPLTGQVDVYQNPATSYVVVTYYDTAYFGKTPPVEDRAALFYPIAPPGAYPTPEPGSKAATSLSGLGTIRCPKGWAATARARRREINCNNQVAGSQGNADLTATLTGTTTLDAAAAEHAATLTGVPFGQLHLAPDLVAFVIQSGLVGTRVEYVRVVPVAGPPAGSALLVANGDPAEVIPALTSFRPPAPAVQTGSTWVQATLPTTDTRVLAADAHPSGAVYLGGDGVYRSTDAGRTWAALITDGPVGTLAVAPSDPRTLYAGLGSGCYGGGPGSLHRSTDGGATWQDVLGGPDHLNVNPSDASDLLGVQCDGVYASHDGGQTWTRTHPASDNLYGFFTLAVTRDNRNQLYALIGGESSDTHLLGSTDGGKSWAPLPNPPAIPGCLTVLAPGAAGQVFCVASGGFFTSGDGGHTWSLQIAGTHTQGGGIGDDFFAGAPPTAATAAGGVPPLIYLGIAHAPAGGAGALFAGDGTSQWASVGPLPDKRAIQDLAVAQSDSGAALIAIAGGNVYRLPLH